MTNIIPILLIGFSGGVLSGLFGIGGAVVIVPMLTLIIGFPQKVAQGTVLALFLISPSMVAAFQYYKHGNTNIKIALILWIGVFIGSAIGAWIVNTVLKDIAIASLLLRRSFSLIMIVLAIKMWFL
ncbi:MAG: TSUP family transporter [Brevinema sp.]